MKLETNLPVIFLTLLVISIVVIGYLELKKLNERIKQLEYLNKEKKKENNSGKEKVETMDNVVHDVVSQEEKVKTEDIPKNTSRVEEWQMNNEKENIINTLNRKEEYIEEINDEEQQMTFFHEGGGMYVQPPMMFKTMVNPEVGPDDIIEKIRNDEDINFENINEEEMFNKLNENTEEVVDGEDEIDIEEQVEIKNDDDDNVSNSEKSIIDNDESGEEINLKEIDEEDDFSKNKIVVDESYSVNDLKAICKNLGLQLSGNKTTLIKRIMDNQ